MSHQATLEGWDQKSF